MLHTEPEDINTQCHSRNKLDELEDLGYSKNAKNLDDPNDPGVVVRGRRAAAVDAVLRVHRETGRAPICRHSKPGAVCARNAKTWAGNGERTR